MAHKYIMINEIIEEHSARMFNLKKYYPFFALSETTFAQYKEGRYQDLDMGYITMASLRFFINENNFNEEEIEYEAYERFMRELLMRDFLLAEDNEELKEVILYIFDKLKNDGKAFEFRFFDPVEKRSKVTRVKFIDSRIVNNIVLYHITSDGIEFYLDTKEIKDESTISIQQLLLEKMIKAKNFKGGIEVVQRINNEVSKLILKKEEVINILSYDIFAGAKASEEYMETVASWFEEEQKLFIKNKELIDAALSKAQVDGEAGVEGNLSRSLVDIHQLDNELKKTIIRHGELISETMDLQNISDHIISKAKLKKLRPVFDFKGTLMKCQREDDMSKLEYVLLPLFKPNISKSFSMNTIDHMLTFKGEEENKGEKIIKEEIQEDFLYPDEIEDLRIADNFRKIFYELLDQLVKKGKINQKELNGILEIKFGKDLFVNGDYYSFMAHLAQKKEYEMMKIVDKQDTFLEGLIVPMLMEEENKRLLVLKFKMEFDGETEVNLGENFTITNINYERIME